MRTTPHPSCRPFTACSVLPPFVALSSFFFFFCRKKCWGDWWLVVWRGLTPESGAGSCSADRNGISPLWALALGSVAEDVSRIWMNDLGGCRLAGRRSLTAWLPLLYYYSLTSLPAVATTTATERNGIFLSDTVVSYHKYCIVLILMAYYEGGLLLLRTTIVKSASGLRIFSLYTLFVILHRIIKTNWGLEY